MSEMPKGRAIRKHVADAIEVGKVDGVKAVLYDNVDPSICYVVCDSSAWAEIQYLAAKFNGVMHTGEHRRRWLDEHPLLGGDREDER